MKHINFFGLLTAIFMLAACAAPIRSDVTRFNVLSEPQGETFIVIAKNPARDGSLELMSYAAEVSRKLQAEGYTPAGDREADLIVMIDFGVSEPLESDRVRRAPPYFGPTYFGRRYRYGYNPYYYNPYYSPYYGSYGAYGFGSFYHNRYSYLYDTGDFYRVVYERIFEIAIQENDGSFVFEGRAVSLGGSKDLPKVMPLMIDALFFDFPGENGSTVRVTIKPEK